MKTDVNTLVSIIEKASDAYYNGHPIMSDSDWDAKVDELKKIDPNHPLLKKVGAPVADTNKWKKVKHEIVHGSQFKVKEHGQFVDWFTKLAYKGSGKLVAQEKLDGITLILTYKDGTLVSAATRGDGEEGEEIYRNAVLCDGVLEKLSSDFSGIIRSELVLPSDRFEKYFKPRGYRNERNSLGVVRSDDFDLIKKFKAIAFEIVNHNAEYETETESVEALKWVLDNGKRGYVVESVTCDSTDDVLKIYEDYKDDKRAKLNHLIDGLVIKLDDIDAAKACGHTDNRPKAQIAWKFPPEEAITTVESITWQMGMTGRIAPVGEIAPIDIGGTTISRVTLNNIDWMKKMNVGIGDKVKIARMNDVIPGLVKVIDRSNRRKDNPANLPKKCPVCSGSIVMEKVHFICPNIDCNGLTFGNIQRWIVSSNIQGIGPSIIRELIEMGIDGPAGLYTLSEKDLAKASGSDKIASKLKAEIDKTKNVKLSTFLYGLNVDALGNTNSTRLAKEFDSLLNVMRASSVQLESIQGIKTNASKIVSGLRAKVSTIKELLKHVSVVAVSNSGVLAGKSFCVTGKTNLSRNELHSIIQDNGGEVKTSVGKDLDFLIMADPNSSSNKATKAKKHGTKLINEETLNKMINS